MNTISRVVLILFLILPGCVFSKSLESSEIPSPGVDQVSPEELSKVTAALRASMKEKNGVSLTRLVQTDLQLACSNARDWPVSDKEASVLRDEAANSVILPIDGEYLGDWREGEKIAQNGKGMQYSDDPKSPNGGNCYACHRLDPTVIAAGNIGPSLVNYGQRGQSLGVLKYTWAKIWNPNVYTVCSHMPRFGDARILSPDQIRHLMSLLLDPESPVNR